MLRAGIAERIARTREAAHKVNEAGTVALFGHGGVPGRRAFQPSGRNRQPGDSGRSAPAIRLLTGCVA